MIGGLMFFFIVVSVGAFMYTLGRNDGSILSAMRYMDEVQKAKRETAYWYEIGNGYWLRLLEERRKNRGPYR